MKLLKVSKGMYEVVGCKVVGVMEGYGDKRLVRVSSSDIYGEVEGKCKWL